MRLRPVCNSFTNLIVYRFIDYIFLNDFICISTWLIDADSLLYPLININEMIMRYNCSFVMDMHTNRHLFPNKKLIPTRTS